MYNLLHSNQMESVTKSQRGSENFDEEGNGFEYPPGTIIKKVVTTVTETTITIGKNGEHNASTPLIKEEKMEYKVMTENPDDDENNLDDVRKIRAMKIANALKLKANNNLQGSNLVTSDKEDEDVRYESDDDKDVQVRRNAYKKYGANFLSQEPGTSKYLNNYSRGNIRKEKPNENRKKFVTEDTLKIFGHVSRVQRGEEPYDIINDYVHNSHGLGDHGTLIIHDIYGINFDPSKHTKSKGRHKFSKQSNEVISLLWCKTTLEIVQRLAAGGNSCVTFYDRLGRAFSKPVNQLKGKSRHVILLCSVSMGNMYKSPHGYDYWRKTMFPHGFDSVRGCGRFSTSWQDNSIYRGWTVPCGETKRNSKYPSYELDFNEYIVNNSKRFKVKIAIDIEITTKASIA